jgi:hypothetical protein
VAELSGNPRVWHALPPAVLNLDRPLLESLNLADDEFVLALPASGGMPHLAHPDGTSLVPARADDLADFRALLMRRPGSTVFVLSTLSTSGVQRLMSLLDGVDAVLGYPPVGRAWGLHRPGLIDVSLFTYIDVQSP